MSELNMDRIINGTLHKRLTNKYNEMKESGLTEESAKEYRSLYENEPLSSILKESEMIFKEPMEGYKFYESIITNHKIPPYAYTEERTKLDSFIQEYGDKMPEEQKASYVTLLEKVDSIVDSKRNMITLTTAYLTEESEDAVSEIYDNLYKGVYDDGMNLLDDMQMISSQDGIVEESIMFDLYPTLSQKDMAYRICESVSCFKESADEDPDVYESTVSKFNIWKYLMEDANTKAEIKRIPNPTIKITLEEASNQNYRRVVDSIFTKVETDFDPGFTTTENAVLRMFDEDLMYESSDDYSLQIRVVNANDAASIVEAVTNIVFAEYQTLDPNENTRCKAVLEMAGVDELTIEDALDYLIQKSNDLHEVIEVALEAGDPESFFEYTRRGEATPVIRKTAGNLREEVYAKDTPKKKTEGSSSADEDDDETDDDWDDPEDDEDNDTEEPTDEKKPDTKEEPKTTDKRETQDATSDFDRKREPNDKPKMQKQTVTRKIQNKAIDLDVKMQKKAGQAKQAATEVKNAAKAVVRLPANIVKSLGTTIDEFNNMDENRRKEKILEPGYRQKIFKQMKTALVYGAIWQYKKYMVIVAWLVKHTIASPIFKANKDRNTRLRNELTHELETEIAVTEEKISDANANGDQKQKYELMRIKKKLEAEKVRVQTNSKYI